MKLTIVIPRYKESVQDMLPLLTSIRSQTAINFDDIDIIISNDNPDDPLNKNKFNLLGLDINIINAKENRGPGIARQRGIDIATGDYIMFCDADDSLYSVGVLSAFEKEFEKYPECDYMSSQWLEEFKVEDGYQYITHQLENTWMHGKIFKRELLEQVRFHEELRVHEDSYFLSIIADIAQSRRQLNIVSYVWRWRDNSITRTSEQQYEFHDFPEFIRAICLSNLALKERHSKTLEYHVIQFLIYCYFVLMQDRWFDHPEFREQSFDTLRIGMQPFWDIYLNADKSYIAQIYNEERKKNYSNEVEKYTLQTFVETMMKPL